jgi:signal transduction histidine kinase
VASASSLLVWAAFFGKSEAANQAKSTLLANISHEICTQRNAILGYARRLRAVRRPLDPAYRRLAGQFKRLLLRLDIDRVQKRLEEFKAL